MKRTITVHILNQHNVCSHIEILLEYCENGFFYTYEINRWSPPSNYWFRFNQSQIHNYSWPAFSTFSFEIEADLLKIVSEWKAYYAQTKAHILANNCAVAAQWFLSRFAKIPEPNFSNTSWNLMALGIIWPSFIPCPVTLPGRIMDNAKFHIMARNHPEAAAQYSHLFLYTSLSLNALLYCGSILGLIAGIAILNSGLATTCVTLAVVLNLASCYGFFKTMNTLNIKNMQTTEANTDSTLGLLKHQD